jgi:glutathione S-transferase
MSPKIHLFLAPGACSIAPHSILHEIDVPFTTTTLDVTQRFPEEYQHINPKGAVPFLYLDSETVTEVPAILTAIAQLSPSRNLLGSTDLEQVRCYEWMNYLSSKLHSQGYGGFFRPGRYVNDESMYGVVREKSKENIEVCYEYIDKQLEGRMWAVGDRFTVVDVYFWYFGGGVGRLPGSIWGRGFRIIRGW